MINPCSIKDVIQAVVSGDAAPRDRKKSRAKNDGPG